MDIRDAIEDDAERMAKLTGSPLDVMKNLVHDRTVRVAMREDGDIAGLVSFDARQDTVYVTQLEGSVESCSRLIKEPVRFASHEGMAIELLIPEGRSDLKRIAEDQGFEAESAGPRFDGEPTVRYRSSNDWK